MDFVDVVEVVSAVIKQLKVRPYEESCFIQKAIMQVEETTRNDLEPNKYFPNTNDEVKKKLQKLLAAVYDMEDFAETFVLQRMHGRRMSLGSCRRYIFILRQMLNLKVDIGSEMRKRKLEIEHAIDRSVMIIREDVIGQSHPLEESDVVGLEEDKGKMVAWLTETKSRPDLGFILISGKTGSGKTTLATEIYKDSEIERHFGFRAWVSASEDPVSNLQIILRTITSDSTVDMKSTVVELEAKICEILRQKRWLVVVDNVQSPYLFKIQPGSAISNKGNGSWVIMTMKSEHPIKDFVAEWSLSFHREPLQDEVAWHLFLKKVRLPDNTYESDIPDELKREIINVCGGNPSAIMVLGRYLSTKKSNEIWSVVDDLRQRPTDGNRVSVSTILALMNSDRTSGLRSCLLYFGLFPKDYKIPVRRLLRLWLAERFVTGPWETTGYAGNPLDAEETAEKYLKELVGGGVIETAERRKDGSTKTCRMPGILHDICLSKTEDTGLLHIHPNPTSPDHQSSDHASPSPKFNVRRVAEHGDITNYSCQDLPTQNLRSYLSFNTQNRDTPALEIDNFLRDVIVHRGFGLLRVLDLEQVYKPKLPDNLGKLSLLRYLGLRWTFLDTLPPSVSELRFLETLDMKHTCICSLPFAKSIWKMKYLRHLCLNEIRLDMPVEKHSIALTGLHTLWGLFVDDKSPLKNSLDTSTNLRKLGLTFHLESVAELNEWIARLEGLESLRLRSKDKNGRPSKLNLNPLSGLQNLTSLYLLGYLPELHDGYFPPSIKVLTLSASKQKKDPMPILAKLPKLKSPSAIGRFLHWEGNGVPQWRLPITYNSEALDAREIGDMDNGGKCNAEAPRIGNLMLLQVEEASRQQAAQLAALLENSINQHARRIRIQCPSQP